MWVETVVLKHLKAFSVPSTMTTSTFVRKERSLINIQLSANLAPLALFHGAKALAHAFYADQGRLQIKRGQHHASPVTLKCTWVLEHLRFWTMEKACSAWTP